MTQNRLRERIFNSIDMDGMVGLVSEAVRVPSITGEKGQVAFLFQRRMNQLGLDADSK